MAYMKVQNAEQARSVTISVYILYLFTLLPAREDTNKKWQEFGFQKMSVSLICLLLIQNLTIMLFIIPAQIACM